MIRKLNLLLVCCLLCLFTSTAFAESNFAIYPTQNHFTQLQLDTRDGQIWQVHIAIDDGERCKIPINSIPLTDSPGPLNLPCSSVNSVEENKIVHICSRR